MKILVVGNGAREHAIAESLKKSKSNPEIINFATARNPGISKLASKIEIGKMLDFEHLKRFAAAEKPDFAVVGPDDPICAGAADALLEIGVKSVAPMKKIAALEGSKSFTRELLKKYEIAGNPLFKSFETENGLFEFAEKCGEIVVKADGLCGGKGVFVQGDHFENLSDGLEIAKKLLKKDGRVVLEEKLVGVEFSYLFFCDGKTLVPMPAVADHKRAFDGDRGPNTGGMGTISDKNHSLPFLEKSDLDAAAKIAEKSIAAAQAETGETFRGILFGGFMATKNGVRLIEWNVRFGDPEGLNLLSLLATDFVEICRAILDGALSDLDIEFFERATVCKYVVPDGYPENPVKNVPIKIDFAKIPDGVKTFFASIDENENGEMILKGSRAIGFVALADTIFAAEKLAEAATKSVSGPVFHRADIGTEASLAAKKALSQKIREQF